MNRPAGTAAAEASAGEAPALPHCPNCGAVVATPWCGVCGQRFETHLRSLGGFLAEAGEDLTHADSRLWRTLLPLIGRPGFLTEEFLRGRRARYLPPLRLYLLISAVFFLLFASFPDIQVVAIDFGRGTVTPVGPGAGQPCDAVRYAGPGASWIEPRMRESCERIIADRGRDVAHAVVHNLPKAVFLFLPLIAALMKLLYWRSRRLYVEHLLFLVHDHALTFLVFIVWFTISRLAGPLGAGRTGTSLVTLPLGAYLVWYLYTSLRRVYGDGPWLTAAKFATLGAVYIVGGMLAITATALISAMDL